MHWKEGLADELKKTRVLFSLGSCLNLGVPGACAVAPWAGFNLPIRDVNTHRGQEDEAERRAGPQTKTAATVLPCLYLKIPVYSN